jgi:hypothetical protein
MVAFLALGILAFVNGWYVGIYALVAGAVVLGFIFSINVARLDDKPSYEDSDRKK